ncbi:MAG: Hsp20/alpha crystallin family protein [candidate division WOR-3 bacterium]|nr:Hsp20/alpha crystallin family protein [candidate division WOR-3 bacterium]MDW8113849.1 Hsp20/alpha crystallin family protein [candidate division WOR-3 bacterium]
MRHWLRPWTPLAKELEELEKDIKRTFEEFFGRRRRMPAMAEEFVPLIDMYEKGNDIIVEAEIPGLEKEDLSVTVSENSLTIKGEIKKEKEVKEKDYYLCERSYGSFSRTIELPTEVDSEKAKASYKNGILKITLPKKQPEKKLETEIKIE